MIMMTNKRNRYCIPCASEGIQKRGTFSREGHKEVYCSKHKSDNDTNVMNKQCEKCSKQPAYGPQGGKALRCMTHKLDGDINVKSKRCELCDKIPVFGVAWKKPLRCKAHKLDGYVDVMNKKCEKCDKIPTYGTKWKKPLRCGLHKLDGDTNVKTKRCEHCDKIPSFGPEGGKRKALRCIDHKLIDDVYNGPNQCKHINCIKQSSFGPEDGRATRCADHMLFGDVNLTSKKCEKCNKQVRFGPRHGHALRCSDHKLINDIDATSKKCSFCLKTAVYGTEWRKPLRCLEHRFPGDMDAVNKTCATYGCDISVSKKKTYCANCDTEKRLRRVKEMKILDYLNDNDLPPIRSNKQLDETGCGRYRPDFLYYGSFGKQIIVECDEDAHKDYLPGCELKRMVDIHAAGGGVDTVFIRLNPDKIVVGRQTKRTHLSTRLAQTKHILQTALSDARESRGTLTVHYLYYGNQLDTIPNAPRVFHGDHVAFSIDCDNPEFPFFPLT